MKTTLQFHYILHILLVSSNFLRDAIFKEASRVYGLNTITYLHCRPITIQKISLVGAPNHIPIINIRKDSFHHTPSGLLSNCLACCIILSLLKTQTDSLVLSSFLSHSDFSSVAFSTTVIFASW